MYDIKVIVQNITKGARNELERLRAIWVWLCHNIGGYFITYLTFCNIYYIMDLRIGNLSLWKSYVLESMLFL